jgi:ribA/ribD-fused uncharacterized protein
MITSFKDKNRWLSNFWPCLVQLDCIEYPSVENAYQAAKTLGSRESFQSCTAAQAKRLGRKLSIRSDWEELKVRVMQELLMQKFSKQNLALREALKATGDEELVEGNTWGDIFWGVCNDVGENNLGKLLMQVRTKILAEDA